MAHSDPDDTTEEQPAAATGENTGDPTTLFAVYNDQPRPETDTELPVVQRMDAPSRLAVFPARARDNAGDELEKLRERWGDHLKLAEITVTNWNAHLEDSDRGDDLDDESHSEEGA